MDVVKTKLKHNRFFKKPYKVVFLIVSLIILALFLFKQTIVSISVDRTQVLIEKVQQGDLAVSIAGYGNLRSDKLQLITSLTKATVKEILLKPGAIVTADSVIVRLENPELQQLVENSQQELAQKKANLRQLKLNNQREKLHENANLAEISALYETAILKRKAQEKLAKSGIVTQLTLQQTLLNETQLAKRIAILKQRTEQLTLVHQEAVNIQNERIKQQLGQLNITMARANALVVKAGFNGVLQRLTVELGQSLAAGQEIALIGSVTDLIAMIRVPQSQAQQITVGQTVIIDTRRDKITGKVARIDPIVENNTVNIEVSLPKILPASARPQLNVDGVVIAKTLENVTYIKRPANVKTHAEISLYKLNENLHKAELWPVKFGYQAGQFIEIVSGAKRDEQFIISDLSNLKHSTSELAINY